MNIKVCISETNFDFVNFCNTRYDYYWFDSYPLAKYYYQTAINGYLTLLTELANGICYTTLLHQLLKLKIIAKKNPVDPWLFPIIVFNNYVLNGTGRIILDRYVFNKPNEKTILICPKNSSLQGEKIESLSHLNEKIQQPNMSVTIKKGLILSMEPGHFAFKAELNELEIKNKDILIAEVKAMKNISLASLIDFINNDNLIT